MVGILSGLSPKKYFLISLGETSILPVKEL